MFHHYPPVGSLWKYTGRNPSLVDVERWGPEGPDLEILERSPSAVTSRYGTDVVTFKSLGRRSETFHYPHETFIKYFVPKGVQTAPTMVRLITLLGELKPHPEEIYELLVALEI